MIRLALTFLLLAAMTPPADAQGRVCAKRDKLIAKLAADHGETRQSVGLQRNNGVIETFANTETGSWSIIVSLPTSISCLVAAGEAYERDAAQAGEKDQGL